MYVCILCVCVYRWRAEYCLGVLFQKHRVSLPVPTCPGIVPSLIACASCSLQNHLDSSCALIANAVPRTRVSFVSKARCFNTIVRAFWMCCNLKKIMLVAVSHACRTFGNRAPKTAKSVPRQLFLLSMECPRRNARDVRGDRRWPEAIRGDRRRSEVTRGEKWQTLSELIFQLCSWVPKIKRH